MFSNKTKTARKGGWLTLFGVICYNHCGHCYIRRSDPLFLSRSPRQEGGGASAEESISAFCMCGHCTVHFLYKSAMTVRLVPETVINTYWLNDEDLTAVTVSLWLYYSISPGFVKRQSWGTVIRWRQVPLRSYLRQHRTIKTAVLCGNFVSWLCCSFTVIHQVLPQNCASSVCKIYSQITLVQLCGIALNHSAQRDTIILN